MWFFVKKTLKKTRNRRLYSLMGIQITNLEHITEMPKQKSAFGSSPTTAQPIQGQDEATLTKVVGSVGILDGKVDCSNPNDPDIDHVPLRFVTELFTNWEDYCKAAVEPWLRTNPWEF
ncbi:hypothetical protein BJP34_27040 [Moorena producens PAL-8-15-08-1]|uniref:Uncharacterized protein n=2 Tax=Moorena TaxID=1155738 RepID=A0A1D8TY74_9CYAN|nr:hypothetical protein BJP34_27040 [Moorena producens PAL-8-15-08-1]